MTDSHDQRTDDRTPHVSRRGLLGTVGVGVGLGALPGRVAAADLDQTDDATGGAVAGGTGGFAVRSRLYPVRSDFHGETPQRLRAKRGCFKPRDRPIYGPTDVNAQSANGSMAVAINGAGTMSVLRWPRPSFYEQLKYFAEGRDADDEIVVAPNNGAFLGQIGRASCRERV